MKKYSFFKNASYAIEGFFEVLKNETAFKLQLLIFIVNIFLVIILKIEFFYKLLILASAVIPLIVELLNSAIERVVDLVTKDYHQLAKNAKDAASGAVMVSFVVPIFVWIAVIIKEFF